MNNESDYLRYEIIKEMQSRQKGKGKRSNVDRQRGQRECEGPCNISQDMHEARVI